MIKIKHSNKKKLIHNNHWFIFKLLGRILDQDMENL